MVRPRGSTLHRATRCHSGENQNCYPSKESHRPLALRNLRKVIGELVFLDDEKAISIRLDQPKIVKPLHKQADPWPRRADHLGEFFRGNLQLDANAARVFLAECTG